MNIGKFLSVIAIILISCSCQQAEKTKYSCLELSSGWSVFSSKNMASGQELSTTENIQGRIFEAKVPSTIMGTLTANGLYKNIFTNDNIHKIDREQFEESWWYHNTFTLNPLDEDQHVFLILEGISYYANIWLNGNLIASKDSIYGAYRHYEFEITDYIDKTNILAIEVFRAQAGDPNIGFADWNPRPPDENMGLFRPVKIYTTGNVRVNNLLVRTKLNTQTLNEAWLTLEADIVNLSPDNINGILSGKLDGNELFTRPLQLEPNEKSKISLSADDIEGFHIQNPHLWWCNNMGEPDLYDLELSFSRNDTVYWKDTISFGIRDIESFINEDGHREFRLNGQKVLLKAAGWTDDIFLRDTPQSNEQQVKMVKDMNLNTIRFEGFWGNNSNIYELCDKYGIMAVVGWSCHWEWENYYGKPCSETYGCIQSDEEIDLIARSFEDQVKWLRNHPSIIAWMPGSDMLPIPELEEKYIAFLSSEDSNRPYVGAAKSKESNLSGKTGTKMAGPYEYVGPNYWYTDDRYGGAFGFNTETGIGAQLPVYESLKRFIPADSLWPISKSYDYHCTTSANAMNNLDVLSEVISNKYGEPLSLQDYLLKADLANYDATRAMFEAFRVNINKTTGIVQWMLNSAWPSLYWQLYDYYLMPTSGYYAVKKANEPAQLIYHYGENSIYAVNESLSGIENYKAKIKVYNADSKLIDSCVIKLNLENNTSTEILKLDKLAGITFISLKLFDKDEIVVSDNFYCLSDSPDIYDWEETNWVHTPIKEYSDFRGLSKIPHVKLEYSLDKHQEDDYIHYKIRLKNNSPFISFFNRMKMKDGHTNLITSAIWQDNYISIEPHQERTIECVIKKEEVEGKSIFIEVEGWNGKLFRFN